MFLGPVDQVTTADALFSVSSAVSGFDAGDVDGDGQTELLIGDEGYETGGRVLFYNGRAFTSSETAATVDARLTSVSGAVVARAVIVGDIDLDGISDILTVPRPIPAISSVMQLVSGTVASAGGDRPIAPSMLTLGVPALITPAVDAAALDVNADGSIDILIALPTMQSTAERGGVFLVLGLAP